MVLLVVVGATDRSVCERSDSKDILLVDQLFQDFGVSYDLKFSLLLEFFQLCPGLRISVLILHIGHLVFKGHDLFLKVRDKIPQ